MQFYLLIFWHLFLSYQLLLVLISWLYVSHSPNPALKGEWDFSKIVVIGRGGGGGEWKIFARNGGKPGKGWGVGFVMRGDGKILWSFTDWRIAATLSFWHLLIEELLLYFLYNCCLRFDAFEFQRKFSLKYTNFAPKEN